MTVTVTGILREIVTIEIVIVILMVIIIVIEKGFEVPFGADQRHV